MNLVILCTLLFSYNGYALEAYPFDTNKIKILVDKFSSTSDLQLLNLRPNTDEEYNDCTYNSENNKAEQIFKKIMSTINPVLIGKIKLRQCSFKSHFVAAAEVLSIYYDLNSLKDIYETFKFHGEADQILTMILSHELGHIVHEFSTQESVSGFQGLSLNGTVSDYQHTGNELVDAVGRRHFKSLAFHEPFLQQVCIPLKNTFTLKNNDSLSFENYDECTFQASNLEHYEVDAIGLEVALRVHPGIDLTLFNKYLHHHAQVKKTEDQDSEFHRHVDESYQKRSALITRGSELLR